MWFTQTVRHTCVCVVYNHHSHMQILTRCHRARKHKVFTAAAASAAATATREHAPSAVDCEMHTTAPTHIHNSTLGVYVVYMLCVHVMLSKFTESRSARGVALCAWRFGCACARKISKHRAHKHISAAVARWRTAPGTHTHSNIQTYLCFARH